MSLLAIFVQFPWLALVPALAFAFVGRQTGRGLPWIAATLWLLYAVYEMAMKRRILCSGECNIRVDLVLLYPVLLLLSLGAIVGAFRARRDGGPTWR